MFKLFSLILVASIYVAAKEALQFGDHIPEKRHMHSHGDYWAIAHCWDHGNMMDPFCAFLFANCANATKIENGYIGQKYNTTIGSTVNYVCNNGYTMTGLEVGTCEQTDPNQVPQWSKPPTCTIITCPDIPDIENGYHEASNSTDVGTSIQYFCNDNYAIEDNDTTTCVIVGAGQPPNWSQPLPKCKESVCRLPSEIINGIAVVPNPLYVATTAVPDTTTSDFTTTTIPPDNFTDTDTDNTTTTSLPDTNETATISPETLGNTSVSQIKTDNDTTTDSSDASDDAFTTVQDTLNFTTTNAPDTSNDTSTDQPGSSIDTNTTFSDNSTEITTVLTTGSTTLSTTIPPYIPVTNDTVFQINQTVIYQCTTGYGFVTNANTMAVRNSVESTCVSVNKTTTWSTTVVCVPDCESVPDVMNANYTAPSNTLQGSSVIYSCYPGLEMIGPSNVTCLPTGNWSELPFCRACGEVPSIANGSHTIPEDLFVGTNVTYSCNTGWTMSGSPDVVCQKSGNWSQLPVCDRAVCLTPPNIPNSIPTRFVYNQTDKVIFTCEEHYILVGNNTLECIYGKWTTPFPYCECQIQPIDIVFIIDGSGSLGLHGFQQTLDFVVAMVKSFPVDTTNFGLVTFASSVFRQFYLGEYANNTAGLIERIQNTTYPTGGTYTYSALTYARQQMFQEMNGMRPNVTHTAIIVTDGQSNDFNQTVEQAELLKAAGVTIYSVGVGLTNRDELTLMASKPSYVFTVDNYDLIDQIAGPLAGITCSSTHGASDEARDISL